MNYKSYAKAVFEVFLNTESTEFDNFFQKFISELKLKNRISLLPKILKEAQNLIDIEKKSESTEIVLKNKDEFLKFENKVKELSNNFNLDDLKIVENKNIVGGFILRNSKYIFDKSYKKGLLKMYQKLTK